MQKFQGQIFESDKVDESMSEQNDLEISDVFRTKSDNFWPKFSQMSDERENVWISISRIIFVWAFLTKITVIRVKLIVLNINSDASFKIELRKNGIMNLYWIDTTLINTINVIFCISVFSVHSFNQFERISDCWPPYILHWPLFSWYIFTSRWSILYCYSSLVN